MTKKNYVDNKELYKAMVEYKDKVKLALDNNKTKPRIPEYIGGAILLIAKNFTNYYKFKGYHFKEDMVSDAYFNCIKYIDNFNHEKYKNPHAYFTMICYRAFQHRIKLEKRQLAIKYKNMENDYIFDELSELSSEEKHHIDLSGAGSSLFDRGAEFLSSYEKSLTESKEKRKMAAEKRKKEKMENNDAKITNEKILDE